jgi:hypothetical protein
MPESNLTIILTKEMLQKEVNPLETQVSAMIVRSMADVATLKEIYSNANLAIAKITEQCRKSCDAAHLAHKEAVALRDNPIKDLNRIKVIANQKIAEFAIEQKRLMAEADRAACLTQEAERQKVMDAAQAKITRAMGTANKIEDQLATMLAVAVHPDSTDTERELAQRHIEILRLKLENQQDKAAAIQKTAEQAADALPIASAVAVNYERVKGVKTVWIPEVTDKMALIKAVAEGRAPESVVDINLGMLKKLANMGVKFNEGVRLTEEAKYGGRG